MAMFKKWMFLLGIVLPLMGCHTPSFLHDNPTTPVMQAKVDTRFYTPDDFIRLDIKANVNLHIHTGARRAWFSVNGDTRDLDEIKWEVKKNKNTLRIRLDGRYPKHGPITVDVGLRELYDIKYIGKGNIIGRRLYSNQLDVKIKNGENTTTLLEGHMNLNRVMLRGAGNMELRDTASQSMQLYLGGKVRVKISGIMRLKSLTMHRNAALIVSHARSKFLNITMAGSSRAKLSGHAQFVIANLEGASQLNARGLRINEAFVKTQDNAIAQIYVLNKQHTLATDQSNIYYYNKPTYNTNFMGKNGAVLNLGAEQGGRRK
jgi:hypothetical protein